MINQKSGPSIYIKRTEAAKQAMNGKYRRLPTQNSNLKRSWHATKWHFRPYKIKQQQLDLSDAYRIYTDRYKLENEKIK